MFFFNFTKKNKLKSTHVARANMQFHINFAHPIRKKNQKSWLHGNSDVYHYCKKHRPVTSEWPRWWIALQNFQEIDFRFLFFVEDGEKQIDENRLYIRYSYYLVKKSHFSWCCNKSISSTAQKNEGICRFGHIYWRNH